jgi:hypothetical protein
MNSPKRPSDLRADRRQAERRLLIAVILFLVIVGGGLILIIYGASDALMGLPCLLAGVGLILLIYIILNLVERWVKDD